MILFAVQTDDIFPHLIICICLIAGICNPAAATIPAVNHLQSLDARQLEKKRLRPVARLRAVGSNG